MVGSWFDVYTCAFGFLKISAAFSFKALRPTFDGRPMRVSGRREGDTVRLWAQDHEGWLTMDAVATLR